MTHTLENVPCLFFSCNDQGIICDANNLFCQSLGYEKSDLLGKNVEQVFTISTRIFYQTHFFPMLSMHGHAEEIYITLLGKNKEHLPVLFNASREQVDGVHISRYAGIIVKNRNKFEDELVKARNEAQEALHKNTLLIQTQAKLQNSLQELDNKLSHIQLQNEELEQFNHAITHDLQEPIRKLTFFASMLMDSHLQKTGISYETILPKMQFVVQKMSTIIQALQQHAWLRTAPLQLQEINLADVVKLITRNLEDEFGKDIISLHTSNLHPVIADKKQFQIAIREILLNAVKYRSNDHLCQVQIKMATVQDNQFRNIADKYKFEKYSRIDIHDNGIGFDPRFKEEVFSLFKRLHNNSGNGIGLSLAKKVVLNHHGKIMAESKPGQGCTISILLPCRNGNIYS